MELWEQHYLLFGGGLAVSTLVAVVPILLLLVLLVLRRPAWVAAVAGLVAATVLAVGAYGMSGWRTLSAAAYGASFGLFPITWIVVWALVLYEVNAVSGKFEVIKASVSSLTTDTRMQALLIGFAFAAFLEGCAGFGTPVAVAAAMMVGLGFTPLYAASVCLLANTAPVAFGSIGVPVITLAAITGLPVMRLGAAVGRICAPVALLLPAYLVVATSGWGAAVEVWPALLTCGASFAVTQYVVSNWIGPQLTDVFSSLAAMGAMGVLLRWWTPRQVRGGVQAETGVVARRYGVGETVLAWVPYGLLVGCVLLWSYPAVQRMLQVPSVVFAWPGLHDTVMRMPPVVAVAERYPAMFVLNWLSSAGTACMVAALSSAVLSGLSARALGGVVMSVARRLVRPTVTVAAMLGMAFEMNYCGATGTLGLAFSTTGGWFPFFSPLMGWLGVFLTGSDTASNALFGSLQTVSAQRLGLDPVLIAAANSAGGVMGKMISLPTIAVAAAATEMSLPDQAKLFRFTLRHSLVLAVVTGVEVMLYALAGR